MFIGDKEKVYNEIKNKLDFSDQEWRAFQEKQISLKPFNDKEWKAFQLIRKEIESSHISIGVNFFSATQVKTKNGWKRLSEEYRISESTYNKPELTQSNRVEPFDKWDAIWWCFILTGIILIAILVISFVNSFGWKAFWDILSA